MISITVICPRLRRLAPALGLLLLLSGPAAPAKPRKQAYTPASVAADLERIQKMGMAAYMQPPDEAMQVLSDALDRGEDLKLSPEVQETVSTWKEEKRLEKVLAGLPWKKGPVDVPLADLAHVTLPEGYKFLDWEGVKAFFSALGKPEPATTESVTPLGMVMALDDTNIGILKVLHYGHIDDGAPLDADKLLAEFNDNRGGLAKQLKHLEHPEKQEYLGGTSIYWTLTPALDKTRHTLAWGRNGDPDLEEQDEFDFVLFGKDTALQLQVANPALGDTEKSPFGVLKPLLEGFEYRPGQAYVDHHGRNGSISLTELVRGPKTSVEAQSEAMGEAIAAQAQGPSFWDFLKRHSGKLLSLLSLAILCFGRLARSRKTPEA